MSVVELESTNLVLAVNKFVITRSFFSNSGVKPTVREATQNSSHLKERLGSIVTQVRTGMHFNRESLDARAYPNRSLEYYARH